MIATHKNGGRETKPIFLPSIKAFSFNKQCQEAALYWCCVALVPKMKFMNHTQTFVLKEGKKSFS